MMEKGSYSTDCLFEAATIILLGYEPSSFIPVHSNGFKRAVTIAIVWNDLPKDISDKIKLPEFKVNPIQLKEKYLELKRNVHDKVKEATGRN